MTVQAVRLAAAGLGGLGEAACAPLVARALAAEVAPDLGFRDRASEQIYRSLQPELEPHRPAKPAMLAHIATTWVIDQIVGSFTSRHPHAQIVDLGAGLSTRFQRIDNGMLTWIDVDRPEIVTLRETLFPFCDRRRMVGADVGGPDWIESLELRPAPTLVVAEGLFAFAAPEMMTTVLADLSVATGARTELVHDFSSRLLARRLAPRAPSNGAPIRRGIRRRQELTRDGWQLVGIHPVYEAMGLPYSAIGAVLARLGRCCPHGVAHIVCTAATPAAAKEAAAPPADAPATGGMSDEAAAARPNGSGPPAGRAPTTGAAPRGARPQPGTAQAPTARPLPPR